MGARVGHDLLGLRFGDVPNVDTGDAAPLVVNAEHDLLCLRLRAIEEATQDLNDELHGRVVVVVQDHLKASCPPDSDVGGEREFVP